MLYGPKIAVDLAFMQMYLSCLSVYIYSYQGSGVTGHLITHVRLYVDVPEQEPKHAYAYPERVSVLVVQAKPSHATLMTLR